MRRPVVVVISCLLASVSVQALAQSRGTVRTVALTGQTVPGTTDRTFTGFGEPQIGYGDAVMFPATLSGSPQGVVDGIWVESLGAAAAPLALRGAAVPGLAGDTWGTFEAWNLHDPPLASISATTYTGRPGIWTGSPGNLRVVALQATAAPGTGDGSTFQTFGPPRNSAFNRFMEHISFRATVAGAPVGREAGIWSGTASGLHLVARTGTPAPGAGGANFATLDTPATYWLPQGSVAFRGTLDNPSRDQGIWVGGPGDVQLAHRAGGPAPGTGAVFNSFDEPQAAQSNNRNLAFRATLRGAGIGDHNKVGIYSGWWNASTQVARSGLPVAGHAGLTFAQLGTPILRDNGDEVGFRATLAGTNVDSSNDDSIWWADPRLNPNTGQPVGDPTFILLAREGQAASGVQGAAFASFETPSLAHEPMFTATVAGPGIDASNDRGVWAYTYNYSFPVAQPVLLLREGDSVTVAPGDVRVIEELMVPPSRTKLGGEPGWEGESYNFTVVAEFTDGTSGILNVRYVPEPGIALLGAIAAMGICTRPTRRSRSRGE